MTPPPWMPEAVRAYLLADTGFATLVDSRVGSILPSDMTKPFLQIRVVGNGVLARFAHSPLLQLDPWVPKDWPGGSGKAAWNIAVQAGELIDVARNVLYGTTSWSGRWLDGPLESPHVDTSRGDANPLYGAPIRVELKTHTR